MQLSELNHNKLHSRCGLNFKLLRHTKGGHLAVLQWANAHGCGWNAASACELAAEAGHLAVLKWARAGTYTRSLLSST
jgi:hypothetical protein